MTAPSSRQSSNSKQWFVVPRHMRRYLTIASITLFTTMLLTAYLSPLGYMITTALKDSEQFTDPFAPLWPASPAVYVHQGPQVIYLFTSGGKEENVTLATGDELDIYRVPSADGSGVHEWAMIAKRRGVSFFVDPANPRGGGTHLANVNMQLFSIDMQLFSVEWDLKSELEEGVLSDELRQEFQGHGISLSDDVAVAPTDDNNRWQINDENAYIIERASETLYIVQPYTGLEEGFLSDELRQELQNKISLSDDAAVAPTDDNNRWRIDDKDTYIIKGTGKALYDVYEYTDDVHTSLIEWEGEWRQLRPAYQLAPNLGVFPEVWEKLEFPRVFRNTLVIAIGGDIGTLISCILVAYGFSRFRIPGKNLLMIVLVGTIILPAQVTLVPTFAVYAQIGWIGTFLPLIVPHFFANAFNVFLLRQFFMTIPKEMDEAAMIDGASPFRTLVSVILPQSVPAIITVALFHFMWAWNEYNLSLIFLSAAPDLQPISVSIHRFNQQYAFQPYLIQASALIAMVVPVIIFFVAQRVFMQSVIITGVEK